MNPGPSQSRPDQGVPPTDKGKMALAGVLLAIPIVVGGVGAGISEEPGKFLAFLGLYDLVFAILSWAAFEYVVTE